MTPGLIGQNAWLMAAHAEQPNKAGGIGAATDLIPDRPSLSDLVEASRECRACRLWERATQTVFGEGTSRAGQPFVGPAGKLLDRALDEAGIDCKKVYVTNAVKHFKFEPRGKMRIHKKPAADEIAACRPWLEAELALVRPKIVVCLGATAAQALIGRDYRVSRQRGQFIAGSSLAPWVTATVDPSSILRAPDEESRHLEMNRFVQDLAKVATKLRS